MRGSRALCAALVVCASGLALVGSLRSAPAAESFSCGAGGKANPNTAQCDCPGGKVQVTVGKVSYCVEPKVKAVDTAAPVKTVAQPPPAPVLTCAAGEHESEGHCCGAGEEWFAKATKCACVDEAACKAAKAKPSTSATVTTPPPPPPPPPFSCPPDMVMVKGGRYWVGSNEAQGAAPPHQVDLRDYCIDKTEVTVADYQACVQSGACSPAATTVQWEQWNNVGGVWVSPDESTKKLWSGYCNAGRDDKKDHPINCVDWMQAEAFCEALGKKLPSEEEWEVAARGAEGRMYSSGNGEPSGACWKRFDFDKMKGDGTCAVTANSGADTPNGISGMTGNVWEWTSSRGPTWGKFVDRGGAWSNDDKAQIAATFRAENKPTRRGSNLGFRCAR